MVAAAVECGGGGRWRMQRVVEAEGGGGGGRHIIWFALRIRKH